MKAFVMAAGVGERLRPLTTTIPKPMVPVANRPVMEFTMENLAKHGIRDVAVNLHYMGDTIRRHFGSGSQLGVRITYSNEPVLLGTAGGVKKMSKFLNDGAFAVMSGDGLSDVDLDEAFSFHKKSGASATMVLREVDARLEYGVAMLDRGGRMRKFLEKPSWSGVFANTVNSGIYIFEPEVLGWIPKHQPYDFGHDLWPWMLRNGKRVFGYVTKAYWCDIGNLQEYKKAQTDALEGNVRVRLPGRETASRVWIGNGTRIHSSARLKSPCVVGDNCRVDAGAVIGPDTVIGNGSRIGGKAEVQHSVLWKNVKVHAGVKLDSCILTDSSQARENLSVFGGALLQTK